MGMISYMAKLEVNFRSICVAIDFGSIIRPMIRPADIWEYSAGYPSSSTLLSLSLVTPPGQSRIEISQANVRYIRCRWTQAIRRPIAGLYGSWILIATDHVSISWLPCSLFLFHEEMKMLLGRVTQSCYYRIGRQ